MIPNISWVVTFTIISLTTVTASAYTAPSDHIYNLKQQLVSKVMIENGDILL